MKPENVHFFGRDAMHCVSTILIIIGIMTTSCKKQENCKLKLTEQEKQAGWIIVGNDKDCYKKRSIIPCRRGLSRAARWKWENRNARCHA